MAKVINKKYIKDFTKSKLQYLTKDSLIDIARKQDIKIKISDYKDNIAKAILDAKCVDYWSIYQDYKKYAFGLHPADLERLLNIDKKQRKKLEGKLIKVAYYQESSTDWGKIQTPYYDLESLYKLNNDVLDEWKEKHKSRAATPKQLEALEKAREKAKLNLTCGICNRETSKKFIRDRICDNCRNSIEEDIERESFIDILRGIKSNKDEYVVAHFETTGLADNNEIISCSVCDLNENILLEVILKPSCQIRDGAADSHKITSDIVNERGITKEEFMSRFKEVTKDKTILVWNLDFLKSKIINFASGGHLERYYYCKWDNEYNEEDYLEYRKKFKERKLLYKSLFPNTVDLYINYAYETYEIENFYSNDRWTSVHRCGYVGKIKENTSITTRGCLNMIEYLNKERKPLKLPQFWIDNVK